MIAHQEAFRKHAEALALQQQADLAHMMRLTSMGEMASGIAHELNQPLTAISMYVSVCKRKLGGNNASDDALKLLDNIQNQSVRASRIIRKLREFVRKQHPVKAPAAVADIIHDVLVLLDGSLRSNKVKIKVALPVGLPSVDVDQVQIEQVVFNILQNAIDAVTEVDAGQRLITMTCQLHSSNQIQLDITDTGLGMTPQVMDQVFDSFFTTKDLNGMGIGLSLSRSIIETHGGMLWVSSTKGKGATFSLTLPIANTSKVSYV